MLRPQDEPLRIKLNQFLKSKKNYNTAELLALVQNSWMKEEQINLLAKDERYEEAIQILVENQAYSDAEAFCRDN